MIDINSVDTFSALLKELQEEGVTPKRQMEVLQCNRQMLTKYRQGSIPSPEKLKRFAETLGYSYTDLLLLTQGREKNHKQPTFAVRTERGAMAGRMFESLPDDRLRMAVWDLLVSLDRDLKKTGSK